MGGGGILCYQPVHHPASVWTLGCGLQDAVQERYENNDVSVPGHRDVPSYGGKEPDSGFMQQESYESFPASSPSTLPRCSADEGHPSHGQCGTCIQSMLHLG